MEKTSINGTSILVIGDIILDEFELCKLVDNPDYTHVPSVTLSNSNHVTLGGAANLVNNLQALGARVTFWSSTIDLEPQKEIEFYPPNAYKIKRFVDESSKHLFRVNPQNRHVYAPLSRYIDIIPNDKIKAAILSHKAVVVSDYDHGLIDSRLLAYLSEITYNTPTHIYLDTSRASDFELPNKKLYVLKLNRSEREALVPGTRHKFVHMITTLGERGACVEGHTRFSYTDKVKVVDSCGCGDTFLAALVYSHEILGHDIMDATRFAISAATLAVQKAGVSTVNLADVYSIYANNKVKATI